VIAHQVNKIFPGLLDVYLGRTNYQAQQTKEKADPNRQNNLWEPVAGDHGARGTFDARSRKKSFELWTNLHRGVIAGVVVGSAIVVTLVLATR
jgi:hypothetical protein